MERDLGFRDRLAKNIYVTSPENPDSFFHPRRYLKPKEDVVKVAREIIAALKGWKEEEYRGNQGLIRASRSVLFPPSAQDINIYVIQGSDGVTGVEMTSQSRGGRGDWGRNKRNVRMFLAELDGRVPPDRR